MTTDYYATLGVAPTTEDVVIRAAYLALMRRYHPDTNASPAATARARAITAAYEVLGDRDKRADYDRTRAIVGGASAARPPPKDSPIGPIVFGGIMLLLIPLVVLALRSTPPAPEVRSSTTYAQNREKPAPIRDPVELRAASPLGTNPLTTADPIPRAADDLAQLAIVPDQAPAQIRPRLADSPVPLTPPPPPPQPQARADRKPVKAAARETRQLAKSVQNSTANRDDNLAALDRHVTLLTDQSLRHGNAAKQAVLLNTRTGFLARRDACRSDSCVRDAYLDRMREVATIMSDPPQPAR